MEPLVINGPAESELWIGVYIATIGRVGIEVAHVWADDALLKYRERVK